MTKPDKKMLDAGLPYEISNSNTNETPLRYQRYESLPWIIPGKPKDINELSFLVKYNIIL